MNAQEIINKLNENRVTVRDYLKRLQQEKNRLEKAFDIILSHLEDVSVFKNDEGKFFLGIDTFSYEITKEEFDLLYPLLCGESK